MPTILAILAEGFEEIEATTPIDLLRRAGVEVVTAALGETMHVTGKCGITIHADLTLAQVESRDFAGVFLPGGPGTKHLRADPRVQTIIERHYAAGRIIAAICAAPTVLHDAGLLTGKRYTAHFSVANELPDILADQRVVEDGQLITSRGAGTALDLGLALVSRFHSPDKAREVAAAICA